MKKITKNEIEERRRIQLQRNIPSIWTNKTVLYIGANINRFHFKVDLQLSGCSVDVLERSKNRSKELFENNSWLRRVYCADVRKVDKLKLPFYDLVMWSHGPAILKEQEIIPTLQKIYYLTNRLLVIMTPWGKYNQNVSKLTELDINQTSLDKDYFLNLGFNVSVDGEKNRSGSNLLAWKFKK